MQKKSKYQTYYMQEKNNRMTEPELSMAGIEDVHNRSKLGR